METWSLKRVLGLSLSVLVLGLPGPLRAGTPGANSTEPVTAAGLSSSRSPAEELGQAGNNTTAGSGESLSPSQRNILLTHTAETHTASLDTEQTFTEMSSRSVEVVSLSTEPLTSTLIVATTESSSSRDWMSSVNTDVSSAAVLETRSSMLTEEARLPQDSPDDTTLRQGDAPASVSFESDHTDSAYASTTSRARNLLSVTSSSDNSTSSVFTEDSHQPPSTWGTSARAAETEDYTHSALSTRTEGGGTTDQRMTESVKGMFSETGSPGESGGTRSLDGQRNATGHQHTSTSEETSDSTPALRVTEPSTDQSEVSVSSTPPVTSPAEAPTNISGTEQDLDSSVGTATESSVGAHSSITENQGVLSLTTAGPTVSSNTHELDESLTDAPVLLTEAVLTTTPVTVTDRSQITEEDTFTASTTSTTSTTTTTLPLPATTSSRFSSTTSSSTAGSPTEAAAPYVTPSTTASTPALRTSAAHPTHRMSPSQTQRPSTSGADPTNATTLQIETSTGTVGITTARSQHITTTTTTTTHSTPTGSTVTLQTTGKQTERGTTQLVTSPTDSPTVAPPPSPRDLCVSNPCMNGGMCVSNKEHPYICHCQPGWTGPNCTQDTNECKRDPCPAGSTCMNTRGSFSCECPLGFDLEDGRTCTKAKTFLGTFTVNRLPHDPVVFRSATMHEIQREIIQLLNASLSAFRGYSRSTLSKKGEDGVHILAVNMFSLSANVTSAEVYNSIQMFLNNCSSSLAHCRMVLHHQLSYRVESLCVAQKTQCNTERSICVDTSGSTSCQCHEGYYKHNPDDLSCLDCGDGYKLENGTCVPCMFGFGGFNCGNFYKLIAVVVSPAGGALLLILVIALIVTCCKRDKNDINKIIFKSGDLQMSPYADFPKNNRISMEWGRETIEMQENGSTKNLLQMTDIYYSPALRNSDLDRNGLYPFTGLPGSRHSCIYPAQWNPSFISDDSRRRDYF